MADFFVTNRYFGTDDDDVLHGTAGVDRLTYTNTIPGTGVSSAPHFSGTGSYSGVFDGSGANNAWFDGIENFSFITTVTGNDNITTGNGDDNISTGGGDDYLRTGGGNDTIDGGAGTDVWNADHSGESSAFNINLNGASAFLASGNVQNIEAMVLLTGSGDDSLTGHQTSQMGDTIHSGDGDDLITLWQGGSDSINGELGNDRLVLTNELGGVSSVSYFAVGSLDGYSGLFDGVGSNDTYFDNINHFTFIQNSEAAVNIRTGTGNDSLVGGSGNDTLNSSSGSDTVDGGAGNDFWISNHSALTEPLVIDLNDVSALPDGGSVQNIEAFSISSGSGDDSLTGHQTSQMGDTVHSGDGDDLITLWQGGSDSINGGEGDNDRLVLTNGLGGVSSVSYFAVGSLNGYSGLFDGVGSNNTYFDNINHFTFIQNSEEAVNIRTGAGNDSLVGGSGNDTLNSSSGNDTIDGGAGTDVWNADHSGESSAFNINLNGASAFLASGNVQNIEAMVLLTGSGDDSLTGHQTSQMGDTIHSGDGDDLITLWQGGSDSINGELGNDRLVLTNELGGVSSVSYFAVGSLDGYSGLFDGVGSNDTYFDNINHFTFIQNSEAAVNIRTGTGNDSLVGGSGNDTLNSSSGSDTVDGGAGNDFWISNHSALTEPLVIDLNDVSALPDGGSVQNIEAFSISSGSGDDSLTGHQTSQMGDTVHSGDGDDLITLWQGGSDSINGGEGDNDRLVLTNGLGGVSSVSYFAVGSLDGYSGLFDGVGSNNTYFDNINHFTFIQNSEEAVNIRTGAGNDSLVGGSGNDTLNSSSGNDTLDGGDGIDNALFNVASTAATFSGTTGALIITSAAGIDTVWDSVENLVFTDTTLTYAEALTSANSAPTGGVTVTGTPIEGQVLTANTSNLADADGLGPFSYQWLRDGGAIAGEESTDYLLTAADIGSEISLQVNYIDGASFAETVTSSATAEIQVSDLHLVGTLGNDTLDGGQGNDTLEGLDGNDLLRGSAGNDSLRGGDGADTLNGGAGDDFIFGGDTEADLRDVVYGGAGNDSIHGGYGNDELRGDAGNDSIEGGFGVDTVIGGDGDDVLTGSAWSDEIFGSNGNDFINGGFGHDRVNGGEGADKFYHLGIFDHGSDWIQDYNAAAGDVLMWGGAAATVDDFQINTADTANAGVDGVSESFIIYRPTGQIMWALVDGDAQTSINLQISGDVFDLLA